MQKVRVLFVDDEPNVLSGLRRVLYGMRAEWDMTFVGSGAEALEVLEREPHQVVVSDMRMPGMDGAQLLNEVLRRHPQIVRIVLSGYSDKELVMRAVGATHQYLSKPCEPETLKQAVTSALSLHELLHDEPSLMPLIARVEKLPSLPSLYTEVVAELQAPEPSIGKIAQIITQDPAIAAKVMQLVNSALFGFSKRISDLDRAVSLMGLDAIKSLVLSAKVFDEFNAKTMGNLSMEQLWSHSTAVGGLAKRICVEEKTEKEVAGNAMTAGLLHDVGKLILAANLPEEYRRVRELAEREGYALSRVEELEFGATHAGLGAYLLGIWGLPDCIVQAVAFHHEPANSVVTGSFNAIAAVHVANILVHEESGSGEISDEIDLEYLATLGVTARIGRWRELCAELLQNNSAAA
jgi:HD-like signal output (HDOD) protein/CheY-like chemotaxis protein